MKQHAPLQLELRVTITVLKKSMKSQDYRLELQKQYIEILESKHKDQCITYPINRTKSKHLSIV